MRIVQFKNTFLSFFMRFMNCSLLIAESEYHLISNL